MQNNLLLDGMILWNNFYSLNKSSTPVYDYTSKIPSNGSINSVKISWGDSGQSQELTLENVILYPNPVSQILRIQIPEEVDLKQGVIQIINTQGVAMIAKNISNHSISLEVGFLKPGLYTLIIVMDDFAFQSRIVKI